MTPHAGQSFAHGVSGPPQRVQDIVFEPAAYQRPAPTTMRFRSAPWREPSARRANRACVQGVAFAVKQERPLEHGLELAKVALPLLLLQRGDRITLELDGVRLLRRQQPGEIV